MGVTRPALRRKEARKMATTLLDTTNFPIYAINILSEDHFVVAGGGGASKTGIPNAFVRL